MKRYTAVSKRNDNSERTRRNFWRKEVSLTRQENRDRLPIGNTETISDTIARRGFVYGSKI